MSGLLNLSVGILFSCLLFLTRCSTKPLHWLTFGDWGEPTAILSAVSRSMGEVASELNPDFIISVGDNFYRWGVSSVDDPLWDHMFESVFDHESLKNIQFRCVLGNHDWWGNATAQIDRHYSSKSPRWYLPNLWYYTIEEFDAPVSSPHPYLNNKSGQFESTEMVKTKAIFIYTDSWVMSSPMGSDITDSMWNEQIKFIEDTLKAAVIRNIDWIFVIGHFPCYSSGEHGDNADVKKILDPLLRKYKVDAYIAGHDHHLELSRPKGSSTSHFLIGSACCPKKHDYFNNKHRIFRTGRGGFASHKLTYSQLHSTYHNIQGNPIFTTTQKRINRKQIRTKLIKQVLAELNKDYKSKNKKQSSYLIENPVLSFIDNEEGELELLENIEREKEQEAIEDTQNKLDEETEYIQNNNLLKEKNLENRQFNSAKSQRKLESNSKHNLIEETILSSIDDPSKRVTLLEAIINESNNKSKSSTKTMNYIFKVYDFPPASKRIQFDEIPTREKFFGIRFPFGARLMRFRIDRKTSGHPRHEYKYAPLLKHSVGVDGSEVTKFSVFQTIAWNEISVQIKSNYNIPQSTWNMMKKPDWKGNIIPWRFVESCSNIIRTMGVEGLLNYRHSFLGIPFSKFEKASEDMGIKKARSICEKVANKLDIHKLLQGPDLSNELMLWDRCIGDQTLLNGKSNSDLKTIIALSIIGTARDNCLLPSKEPKKESAFQRFSNSFKYLLRKIKIVPKMIEDPEIVGGINLNRIALIPMDLACEISTQLINHDLNSIDDSEDLFHRTEEAINSCAQIVHKIATFISMREAIKLCSHLTSYELVGP